LLVAYHDLIGEIIGKGRDIQQLFKVVKNEKELEMLACLNRADITAIGNFGWMIMYNRSESKIKEQALEKLKTND
jgi:UTP:GlnB (protein PII) uridylyltransferase